MTISSSLNAGVSGLTANATRLATISDNIANSSTIGYRRSVVDFSSLVLDQNSAAYAAGGVITNAFKDVGEVGSLISTGNATDLAVAGRGFLPVTDAVGAVSNPSERDLLLAPTGSFSTDESGNLRTESGLFLLGWEADSQGNIGNINRSSGVDLVPINIASAQLNAEATTAINLGINLPADLTASTGLGDPVTLPLEYFDTLGRSQTLTLNFTPNIPATGFSNEWSVELLDNSTGTPTSVGTIDLVFDESAGTAGRILSATPGTGVTYDAATGNAQINLPHGAVDVFIGRPGDTAGLTQLAAPFSPTSVTVDGAPIGNLESIDVDDQGFLQAIYDNGFVRTLFQIPVGDVPNLNGLDAQDGQAFRVSADSGDLFLWDAGRGPVGNIAGFALQESTTDIATELTDLIETQRAYSSNATLVQAVDEILQETTNLRR